MANGNGASATDLPFDITSAAPTDLTPRPAAPARVDPAMAKLDALAAEHDRLQTIQNTPNFDTRGAPAKWRLLVSSEDTDEGKLAALKALGAKDAQPMPGDPGNFVYTSPDTGRLTLFNPGQKLLGSRGLGSFLSDPVGAIASAAPEIGEGVGATLGAIGGGAAGGATGSVVPGLGTAAGALGGGMVGAGYGASAGKETVQSAMRTILGIPDYRTPTEQLTGRLSTIAANAAGQGIGEGASVGIRKLFGQTPAGQSIQEAADRLGIPISTGVATGRQGMQSFESGIGSMGMFGGPGVGDITANVARSGAAADKIAADIAGSGGTVTTGTEGLGGVIRNSAQNAIDEFERYQKVLDGNIDTAIPPDTRVPITNVLNWMTKIGQSDLTAGVKDQAVKLAKELNDATVNGTISFDALRQFRSDIIAKQKLPATAEGAYAGPARNALDDLYGATRQDILDGANSVSPQAGKAVQEHDAFVQMNRDPASLNLNAIGMDDLGKLVEKAPNALANGIAHGNVDAGQTIQQLRGSVAPEDWRNVAASTFRSLGEPSAASGATAEKANFSPIAFASNWRKLSDASKAALFDGYLSPEVRQSVDDLATVTKATQDAWTKTNWSRSGVTVNAGQMMALASQLLLGVAGGFGGKEAAGHLGTVAGAGLGLAAPQAAYRMLQNKAFRSWLLDAATESRMSPYGPLNALARLGAQKFASGPQNDGQDQQQ